MQLTGAAVASTFGVASTGAGSATGATLVGSTEAAAVSGADIMSDTQVRWWAKTLVCVRCGEQRGDIHNRQIRERRCVLRRPENRTVN